MEIETYVTQAKKINPNITDYQIEEYYPDEHPTLHLFEEINRLDANVIELDFEGVEFMSRSFAHEYLMRKSKSEKDIYEKNKCPSIQKMLSAVERSFKNPRKIRVTPTPHPIKIDVNSPDDIPKVIRDDD